ncbi:MAG TPA: hypothetical protein VFR97_02185 [Capillimicrobium sp.]|nr:hypothetical protein [Capillimicrobium sp.]
MLLPTVYLAAVALPLLLAVVAIGLRVAAAVAARIDEARMASWRAGSVTELPGAWGDPGVEVDAAEVRIERGPLQLVDHPEPSTKRCPDCAETVVASARVCKHCQFHFGPPQHGSWAV